MDLSPHDVKRFWSKVDRSGGPDACWEWTAGRFSAGYGAFGVRRSNRGAHRVSWAIAHGEVPDGLSVLHRCDNPPCCNPGHLFTGTQADNMEDMTAKGRRPRGNDHGVAQLNEEQVREVRRLLSEGLAQPAIADRFNVSRPAVSAIATGRNWAWLT